VQSEDTGLLAFNAREYDAKQELKLFHEILVQSNFFLALSIGGFVHSLGAKKPGERLCRGSWHIKINEKVTHGILNIVIL
jgi:hypothetical protein